MKQKRRLNGMRYDDNVPKLTEIPCIFCDKKKWNYAKTLRITPLGKDPVTVCMGCYQIVETMKERHPHLFTQEELLTSIYKA